MPRNSQGQYFLPAGNPVVPGELVKSEWANSTMDDIGNAITNSLDRTGAGGMTGQFKAATGTQQRPGISFVEDPSTGIYKESQGVLAISASGNKQAYATSNGFFVATAPSDKMEVANKAYVDSLASQATEIIMAFGASKTPADLPANGYIPANWDATGSPAFAIQFSAGQSAVYRPASLSDPLYNHVYVFVSTNTVAAGWIDIGTVAGPPGPQGEVGPMGPPGPQGPIGEQGPTGQTGPLGPVGPTGAQGPTGPQGAKGETGPAGQSITIVGAFGKTKTPNDLPSSGFIPANWDSQGNPANDIQLFPGQCLIYTEVPQSDPLYGHLYEYVGMSTGFDANGWVDLGDIQGPAGPQGSQGPQGIQGNVGPQGAAGKDGATGAQGPQGVQGEPGPKGDPGPTGQQGVKGDTGAQGIQGPKGDTGATGPAGGVSSVNGNTGAVTLNYSSVGAAAAGGSNASGTWPISISGAAGNLGGYTAANFGKLAGGNTWTGNQTYTQGTYSWSSPTQKAFNFISPAGNSHTVLGQGFITDASFASISNATVSWQVASTATLGTATAQKPGGGAWADSSDRRLKTDVQTLTTCLDTIVALNPVQYSWVGGYRSAAPQVGFIADEVELVIPSAVTEYVPEVNEEIGIDHPANDNPKALIDIVGEGTPIKLLGFKNDIFAYLVGAIKELKDEVDALKAAK